MSEEQGRTGDQRARLRAPLLVLKVKLDDNGKVFFGYAKNISRSGIFIATANPREPGSRFNVEIPLPHPLNRTVRCTCEVVWKREFSMKSAHDPGMGLKFLDIPEEVADLLDRWVGSQVELPPPGKSGR